MSILEKVIIAITAITLVLWFGLIIHFSIALDNAGGFKQLIIDMGKEYQDIKEQINEK